MISYAFEFFIHSFELFPFFNISVFGFLQIDEHVQRETINHRSLKHPNIIRFKEASKTHFFLKKCLHCVGAEMRFSGLLFVFHN